MKTLAFFIMFTCLAFAPKSCSPANSSTSNSAPEANTPQTSSPNIRQTPEKVEFKDENVSFKGVSFKYDPKIFGKVTAEDVPEWHLENETDKPDGVAPRHVKFTFDLCKTIYCWEGSLEVYPINEFPQMYAVNKQLVQATEKEIEALKKVLIDKNFRSEDQIPYIPFIDAGQDFQAKVRLSPFDKGKGIFFVTHINTEMARISNDHLRYIFEGLTDDGKYYVLAEVPVSVKFLPDVPPREFEGDMDESIHDPYPYSDAHNKRYKDYVLSITTRLEKLHASEFRPDLKQLEKIIESLRIEK